MVGNSCHEFIKLYLSELCSKKLVLPSAFVSKLGGKIPKNCTIKDSDGKIWKVKREANRSGLAVGDGWEELASHHSLVDGDILVFKYDGDSHFSVKIFGTNRLLKRKAPDAVASTSLAKTQRQQGQEECSSSLPRREDFSAQKAARTFTSEYPYFKAIMSSSRDLSVPRDFVFEHIKPKMEDPNKQSKQLPDTKLVVANGEWSVTLNIYFNHRYGKLSAGWVRFVRDNGLEVGDVCIFELINNEPVIMKMSIFKHISE